MGGTGSETWRHNNYYGMDLTRFEAKAIGGKAMRETADFATAVVSPAAYVPSSGMQRTLSEAEIGAPAGALYNL